MEKCETCGIENVMPPPECNMWETPSVKYQSREKVVLNAHGACGANAGGGLFAEKFVKVDRTFRETWNHLNKVTPDWLHHKYIDQMSRHEHKVLTETYDPDTAIVASWDYANRNQAKGVDGKCVEHSPTIGCLVCMVLYNRVGTESMMDVWRIYSPAKDCPEWNAMALSEIISHYRGVPLPKDCPVNVTGPQGGRGTKGPSPTDVRPREDGKSSIPVDANGDRVTGRDVSFGAVPGLMTVHVVGDGKTSTFKGSPEFNTLYDLVIAHALTAICLYFGATAHMSGPVDAYGKFPHTLATRMVTNNTLDPHDGPMNVFEAYDMYRFCVKYVSQPSWANGTGDPPKGIWACNGAYIFGHYNDEDCVVESSCVKGSPTIPLPGSHTFKSVEGSKICYYFRIGARKSDVDARKIREIEYRFLPCRCEHCIDDEEKGIGTHPSLESPGAFRSTCRNTANMGIRHYTNMGKWEKKEMTKARDALAKRRGMNKAHATAFSQRAIATAERLAAEEEAAWAAERE